MNESIGKRIKRLRKENNISAEGLANAIGKSKTTINRYESGAIADIPATIMIPLSQALGTTPEYILYGVEPEELMSHATRTTSSVAERIKHCMERQKKSKNDVIKAVGITEKKFDAMINGTDRTFDLDLMIKFCDYFGMPYTYFVTNRSPVLSLEDNIKALCRIDEGSPEGLAEAIGIDADKVLKPSFGELEKIAEYFGFDVEDLLFKDFVKAEQDLFQATRVRMQTFSKAWAEGVGYIALNDKQLRELIAYANFMLIRDGIK